MLSLCPFDISVGVWAFVIGLSQISSFFSFYLIVQGFHRTYATGAACQRRTLAPPDTWSCPTLGLACVLMSRPISPELVLSPDFWISNTPRCFSFAPRQHSQTTRTPYPQRVVKSDLMGHGAVCRYKRVVPCRCLNGHVKEPYEMSMALGTRP